jgi:4-amino-4-deoxy-L-arabinose transferase-like glycosyltransferase
MHAATTTTAAEAVLARKRSWALIVVIFVALALRLVALWAARDATPVLDEQLYLMRAEALLDGRGYLGSYQSWVRHHETHRIAELPQYPGAYQPPMYAGFIAFVLAITGRSVLAVKLVQVLLSTATVGIVYAIGRSWFDHRRALVAAWICALYPNLIAFSHYLWSETLFIFLLLGVVWLLTRRTLPGWGACVAAGLLLGIAALTRAVILYFTPVLLVWMVVVHRRAWATAAVRAISVAAVMAAVIAPWTWRNYRVHGGFVLIDTSGAFNVWRGNTPFAFSLRRQGAHYDWPFESIPVNPVMESNAQTLCFTAMSALGTPHPTDLEIVAYAKASTIACIRAYPRVFLERVVLKMIDLWNPTSFLVRHFKFGAYGPVAPIWATVLSWAAIVSYVLVMVAAVVGWLRWWRDPRAWLVVLFVGYTCAVHAVAFGLTRFRLPLMPLFILLAANGVVRRQRIARTATAPAPAAAGTGSEPRPA